MRSKTMSASIASSTAGGSRSRAPTQRSPPTNGTPPACAPRRPRRPRHPTPRRCAPPRTRPSPNPAGSRCGPRPTASPISTQSRSRRSTERGGGMMAYAMKPLACDPTRIKGMSEKLIVSHYENNYGGAVRRLNAIAEQLAVLDFAAAPVFVVNGLKREELIAANSMILHELFFASLGEESAPEAALRDALMGDFGSV